MDERTIFMEALSRAVPVERSAYLDWACAGDAALRQRVEALLQSHEQAGSFLTKAVPERLAQQREGGIWPAAADHPVELDFLEPAHRPGVLGRLGHYAILAVIGRGGMGVVLRAFDEVLHRVVAVKVLAAPLAVDAAARRRFTREARVAAAITHENVVTIHAVEEAGPLPYLVMQYVAGMSLQERLDQRGPLPLPEVLRIGAQAAAALAAAHARGLVHRDIKPANILLEFLVGGSSSTVDDATDAQPPSATIDCRVKITDFGLARAVDDTRLTRSGEVAGTPQYMSPEQAEGRSVDHRSDLFSLGSVLYTLCTGGPPFQANSSLAVLKRVCDAAPRPIHECNPDVPPWLVEIIARLHAKDPQARFQSAAELADVLRRRLAQLDQPPARTRQAAPVVSRPGRRWPIAVAAVTIVVAGLLCTGGIGAAWLVPLLMDAGRGEVPDAARPAGAGVTPVATENHAAPKAIKDDKPTAVVPLPPKAEANPFVILARDGRAELKLATLGEAVQRSRDGDTIEVRSSGPFAPERAVIVIDEHALRIRAADGFRPVFLAHPRDRSMECEVLATNAPLVLEGLEFQQAGPAPKPGTSRGPSVQGLRAPVHVANCRFVVSLPSSSSGLAVQEPPQCEVRNCQFVGPTGVNLICAPRSRIGLRNNVLVATGSCLFTQLYTPPVEVVIQLSRNTLVGATSINCMIQAELKTSAGAAAGTAQGLRFAASGNIFDAQTKVMALQVLKGPTAKAELRRHIHWQGNHNLLFGTEALLTLWDGKTMQTPVKARRTEWTDFWADAETDSMHAQRPRYRGGDIAARVQSAPAQLLPTDLGLESGSAGRGAGPGGQDIGADVDLIGPGPAYDRWTQTPEYQEWLKITGHVR